MNRSNNNLNNRIFNETKAKFTRAFRQIVRNETSKALAEAAFPAYAHHNIIINHIMWRRLQVVFEYINRSPAARILDFGCGSGVMAYLLAKAGHQVVMFDTEYGPLKIIQQRLDFPASIKIKNLPELKDQRAAGTFDFIITLDVLEHIEGLSKDLSLFRHLLAAGGELIVSGPTENILYKIGRRLAGRQFSGTYHVSDIRTIEKQLALQASIKPLATIYPLLPLFEVFASKLDR